MLKFKPGELSASERAAVHDWAAEQDIQSRSEGNRLALTLTLTLTLTVTLTVRGAARRRLLTAPLLNPCPTSWAGPKKGPRQIILTKASSEP